MQQRRKLVVGNWKMNGELEVNASLLASLVATVGEDGTVGGAMVVCVPSPYLAQAESALRASTIQWGAQDVSEHDPGAYTGEVAATMLRDFGCRYVIVGHSERRTWFGDTDARVAAKARQALGAGLTPIVCVGETLDERDRGDAQDVVARQLDALIEQPDSNLFRGSIFAYEPIWAIGTGKTATPDEAQAMHAFIREHLSGSDRAVAAAATILYGGSVKASNASALFGQDDIDGGLIGGASLIADDFMGIVHCAVRCSREALAPVEHQRAAGVRGGDHAGSGTWN